jgi:hypothetical protein
VAAAAAAVVVLEVAVLLLLWTLLAADKAASPAVFTNIIIESLKVLENDLHLSAHVNEMLQSTQMETSPVAYVPGLLEPAPTGRVLLLGS